MVTFDNSNEDAPLSPRLRMSMRMGGLAKTMSTFLNTKKVNILEPIETVPIILLKFTPQSNTEMTRLVKERLQESRMIIVCEEQDGDGNAILGLSTTQQELELEAQHQILHKPKTLCNLSEDMKMFDGTVIMDEFQVSNRDSFRLENHQKDDVAVYDASGIFTSADRVMLINSLLESMAVLAPGVRSSFLARKLNEKLNFPTSEIDARFQKLYLLDTLRNEGYVDAVVPIHANKIKDYICSQTLSPFTKIPIQAFRDYYGEEVAFYFAWMKFYITALFFPGMSGLIIFIIRTIRKQSIDTDVYTPFHGLFTFIWAISFIQFWSREEARLSYKWGTWNSGGRKSDSLTVRHEFQGTLRVSEVTKLKEKYYPQNKRKLKYW